MESVPFAESFDALMALPPSSAKLPQEDGAPDFAWADNVGRSVVARKGEERLFATLQWRHDTSHSTQFAPLLGKPVTTNGICRVQLTTPAVDRLATVACNATAGQPLTVVHTMAFGRWLVAMNSDLYSARPWAAPAGYVGARAAEMVAGAAAAPIAASYRLKANQTLVFYVSGGA